MTFLYTIVHDVFQSENGTPECKGFSPCGQGNYTASSDIEDAVTVIAYCSELYREKHKIQDGYGESLLKHMIFFSLNQLIPKKPVVVVNGPGNVFFSTPHLHLDVISLTCAIPGTHIEAAVFGVQVGLQIELDQL